MHYIRNRYKKTLRSTAYVLLLLFGVHFLSVHGLVDNLVYCFEEDGQVNIESEVGSFLFPSEDLVHGHEVHDHERVTFDSVRDSHHDISLSLVCSKEEKVTRFDQIQTLKLLEGIGNKSLGELPLSRIFQLASFTPPFIEDQITSSLQTVILLN